MSSCTLIDTAARVLLTDPKNTLTPGQVAIVLDLSTDEVNAIAREVGKRKVIASKQEQFADQLAKKVESFLSKGKKGRGK